MWRTCLEDDMQRKRLQAFCFPESVRAVSPLLVPTPGPFLLSQWLHLPLVSHLWPLLMTRVLCFRAVTPSFTLPSLQEGPGLSPLPAASPSRELFSQLVLFGCPLPVHGVDLTFSLGRQAGFVLPSSGPGA